MIVHPHGDSILIKLDPQTNVIDTESDVTLYKPDGAHEHVLRTGEVVATGKGRAYKSGRVVPTGVEPGDGVLFIKFAAGFTETGKGIQHVIGKDFAILKPGDILLVYDRKDPLKFTQ